MKLKELTIIDMEMFKLKWRWTDAAYCFMPSNDLSQIHPLNETDAEKVYKKSLSFPTGDSETPTGNSNFIDTKENDISSWLNNKLTNGQILVSWQPEIAVITTKDIFIKYWSDFCYPSSDDVTIWPESEEWVLQYRHYEQFWYGQLKSV